MRELGSQAGFAQEAVVEIRLVGEVLGEDLDGDRALELLVAREVDRGHAAAPEDVLDAIAPAGESFDVHPLSSVVVEMVVPSVVVAPRVVVSSCPFFLSFCLGLPSTQLTSFWRSMAAPTSSSWKAGGMRPSAMAASTRSFNSSA
jgi:hypothetical protein